MCSIMFRFFIYLLVNFYSLVLPIAIIYIRASFLKYSF